MENYNFKQALNRGVPVETPVSLVYSDLYNLCDNKSRFSKVVDKEFEKLYKFVMGENTKLGDMQLFQTMMVTTDSNTLEKNICFSFSGIISSIYINFNIDNMYYDMVINHKDCIKFMNVNLKDFIEKCNERKSDLRIISKEKTLKREFPALYKIYLERKEKVDFYNNCSEILENPERYGLSKLQARIKVFDFLKKNNIDENTNLDEEIRNAQNFSLENFCLDCAETLEYITSRILEIEAYLPNNPIDLSKISHFDKEKIDLYIANQFLLFAENATLEEKQRFLYHVTSYFLSDENRKTDTNLKIQCGNVNNNEFQVNESGYEVTPKNLYDRYKKLLIDNPTLHAIDFRGVDFSNMNLCEVEDYMHEFLNDLSANWEFLPKDDRTVEKNVLDNIVKSSNKEESEKKKKLDRERLLDLYMEKKEFYDSSDPFFRIKGKNTFDGYIGYIYSNGKVILEKYYENSNTSRLAYGEAAYVMDIDKFYSLSRLTKNELITMDDSVCDRIIHKGNWQQKAQNVINQAGDFFQTAKEVKKMVKTNNVEL
ncbi:MAG: hypothetical protein Q4E39_05025 [bacterium]|nr:hypothetical protein [bacterium]